MTVHIRHIQMCLSIAASDNTRSDMTVPVGQSTRMLYFGSKYTHVVFRFSSMKKKQRAQLEDDVRLMRLTDKSEQNVQKRVVEVLERHEQKEIEKGKVKRTKKLRSNAPSPYRSDFKRRNAGTSSSPSPTPMAKASDFKRRNSSEASPSPTPMAKARPKRKSKPSNATIKKLLKLSET